MLHELDDGDKTKDAKHAKEQENTKYLCERFHERVTRPNENKMSHRANYEWRSCAGKSARTHGSRLAPSPGLAATSQ
jgi:hypothetical protein